MALDTKNAVKAASDKTKGAAGAGTTGGGAKSGGGGNSGGVPKLVYIVGAVLALLVIGVIMMAFSGKETEQQQEQATQQTYTDATATASASQGVDVYQTTERDIVATTAEQDYSKELIYFTDPSTGMKMVETPNGPLLVGSAEGAAYIQDYEAKRAEWLAKNQAATGQENGQGQLTASQQQQEFLNQQLASQQARIDALEQDKVNLQSTLEQLEAYSDKQTQTITNLTNRVTQMQPVFDYAAQQSKPKVQVTLTGKNRSVEVEAVSGDMAWVNHEGKSIPVRVGDLLPGTNVRVKAIDSLHNKVILAK